MAVSNSRKMEYLDTTAFSDLQKELINLRVEGKSLTDIIKNYNNKNAATNQRLSREALINCIERSALALRWDKGMSGGNDCYLSVPDFAQLKEKVLAGAAEDNHLDPEAVLQVALDLKKQRFKKGVLFLEHTGSPQLAEKLDKKEITPPVRSWVNKRLEELESSLRYKRLIDIKRIVACTPEHITNYHETHKELISGTPPALLFGADETMLESKGKSKVLTPDRVVEIIGEADPQIPHLTSICCHNVLGERVPPFLILGGLIHLPPELKPFVDRGQIWVASSQSGWQTRDTFLFWVLCFINWMSSYRIRLSSAIANQPALLIMDGHVSRECPIALMLLRYHNIQVLILPSHTSHVLQMFDVGLASPLKRKFGMTFRSLLLCVDKNLPLAPQLRQFAVLALLDAWSYVCNTSNARTAAIATGTFPCKIDRVLESRFVRPLSQQLQERIDHQDATRRNRDDFTINEQVITELDIINTLNTRLSSDAKWSHLCLKDNYPSYAAFCSQAINESHNNCSFLGGIPPFVSKDFPPFIFN